MATQGYGNHDTGAPKQKPVRPDDKSSSDEVSGRRNKPTKEEEAREVNTPGDGALPDPTPNGKTDPGLG